MARDVFESTRWSLVLCAGQAANGQADAAQAQAALEELCRTYWYPLYAFARRRGERLEDAKDVTQGFFAQLLENQGLASLSPEKGRFRAFLLASFKNYLANSRRSRGALRRGGDVAVLSIDHHDFEQQYQRSLAIDCTPEALYDRCWAEALLGRVLELLRQDYMKAGREELFNALQPYLAGGMPRQELADRLGMQPAAVAMSMHRMRRRYAEIFRREIANTLQDPGEVEDELNRLRIVLAKT